MKDLTKLTSRQISQIKNIYKANSSIYSRIETLQKHLDKIQTELNEQLEIIDANEAGVKMLTGGFISKQLIKDEQIPQFNEDGTPKMDKDGKYQQKKRVLTFVVPVQEPTEEVGQEETTTDAGENDLKSGEEAFPDNLDIQNNNNNND